VSVLCVTKDSGSKTAGESREMHEEGVPIQKGKKKKTAATDEKQAVERVGSRGKTPKFRRNKNVFPVGEAKDKRESGGEPGMDKA